MYFRPLDDEGMPTATSVLISDPTEPASDPSVVPFLGGYAVIYQVINGATGDAETRIRLLDSLGNRIERIDLGASSASAPPPAIALAGARELFVAWSSATVGLHAGRVTCE